MIVGKGLKWLCLIALLAFVSCSGDEQKPGTGKDETGEVAKKAEIKIPESGSVNGDTINLSGKFVLFFGPSEEQSKALPEIQDFEKIKAGLMDSVTALGTIKSGYTDVGYFRVFTARGNSMIISKSALKAPIGVLLTDGSQPPSIKKGPHTAEEYLALIKEYFFLQ